MQGLASSDGWSLKRKDIFEVEPGQGYKGCPFKQLIALSKGPVLNQLESAVNSAKKTLKECEANEKAQEEKESKAKKLKEEKAEKAKKAKEEKEAKEKAEKEAKNKPESENADQETGENAGLDDKK